MRPAGHLGSLDAQAAHLEPVQVDDEIGEVDHGPHRQLGAAFEVVAERLVAQVEGVVLDLVAVVAVAGQVRIGAGHSGSAHGPTGLPIHRVLSGTDSPRMTSETGPTVAWRPMRAAGRMTELGPNVPPSAIVTRSIARILSWNRWVWTTQPRPTVAPSRRSMRSASGNQ